MGFPPPPAYPLAIDTDRTLFKVYNTTESQLAADNEPWAEVVQIVPVAADQPEIWANNGFATIEGELFYYDGVDKDGNGKVYRLKGCARNLGGEQTKWNPIGTWVRAYVVAEHHNQLVDAIAAIEQFVGIGDETESLTTKAKEIFDEPDCIDDHDCVDVTLNFDKNEELSNNCEGMVYDYQVNVKGRFTSFKIEFGDGNSSTDLSGRYTYPPNVEPHAVVVVTNEKCTVVQSHVSDGTVTPNVPPPYTPPPYIPLPSLPELPAVVCPECYQPEIPFKLPPIVMPCIELGDISIAPWDVTIPSIITVDIPPIEFPSVAFNFSICWPDIIFPSIDIVVPSVDFHLVVPSLIPITISVEIPTTIQIGEITVPSVISFTGIDITSVISFYPIEIPTFIAIDVSIPTLISFSPIDIPTLISFVPIDLPAISFEPLIIPPISFEPIDIPGVISFEPFPAISFETPPPLVVSWEPAPEVTCYVQIECPPESATALRMQNTPHLDDNFQDSFVNNIIPGDIVVNDIGIPSIINVIAPKIPAIKVVHDIPLAIDLRVPEIPDIRILGPEEPLPTEIRIVSPDPIPAEITLRADIPTVIDVKMVDPLVISTLTLVPTPNFPSMITVDGTSIPTIIRVKGIPDSIELKHNLPSEILLKTPENLEVPLVYRGGPVPIQIDLKNLANEDSSDMPCFALVPCSRK